MSLQFPNDMKPLFKEQCQDKPSLVKVVTSISFYNKLYCKTSYTFEEKEYDKTFHHLNILNI